MDIGQVFAEAVLAGREIEFRCGGLHYFESHIGGDWYIECTETNSRQRFSSPQELISHAVLEGCPIHEIWDEVCIDYIF